MKGANSILSGTVWEALGAAAKAVETAPLRTVGTVAAYTGEHLIFVGTGPEIEGRRLLCSARCAEVVGGVQVAQLEAQQKLSVPDLVSAMVMVSDQGFSSHIQFIMF